jgi:hypothetical protein
MALQLYRDGLCLVFVCLGRLFEDLVSTEARVAGVVGWKGRGVLLQCFYYGDV